MAYSNKFSFCIVVGSDASYSVLNERADGIVAVPYGQLYGIKLINKNNRRATADIKIDGIHVGSYVLNANDSWIVWRKANEDKGFMLVALDSMSAAFAGKYGPNDGTKGVVEVSFKLERERTIRTPAYSKPDPWVKPSMPWTKPDIFCTLAQTTTFGGGVLRSFESKLVADEPVTLMNSMQNCVGFNSIPTSEPVCVTSSNPLGDAVTVDSGPTGQQFREVYIDTEDNATVLRLVLKGEDVALKGPGYCTSCGTGRRPSDKFCGQCGSKL